MQNVAELSKSFRSCVAAAVLPVLLAVLLPELAAQNNPRPNPAQQTPPSQNPQRNPGQQNPGQQNPAQQNPAQQNPAQQNPQNPQQGNVGKFQMDETGIHWSVAENEGLPIKDFLKLAESVTHRVFVYSDTDLQSAGDQKVTWIGTINLKRDEFFGFFQTMLYIKNFGIVVRGEKGSEMIEVVNMTGPKRSEIFAGSRYVPPDMIATYANQTGVSILTSVPLEHIRATGATNALRPFFLPSATGAPTLTLGNVGSDTALLLQGFGPQVFAAYQLIKLVDVPPDVPEQVTEVQRLEHAASEELEPVLNEILNERRGRGAVAQPTGVSGGELPGQQTQLKIMAHAPLNAIILSGTKDQIMEAKDIIARLDIPVEANEGDTHVIRVKNVLADKLRTTLNDFITQDLQAEQTAQSGQGGTAGAAAARRPRKTVVVAHAESNSLLISGTASRYRQLERTIEQLDQRQPQVLIEAAVIELSTADMKKLGVELGFVHIKNHGQYPFGYTSFGLSQFQDTDGNGIPDTRVPDLMNPLQGITGGIVSGSDFAVPVLLNALASDTQANILSLPNVVVNNNENATVSSTENRPTQNVSQGTATTQSGFQGFQDAGIDLNISPSISSNNYLRLNVNLKVSRFTTPFDPASASPGVKSERAIQTQITLPSGSTMVLGGVIDDTESSDSSGIPFLKDIPILGYLFQSTSKTKTKTNLYFFLTPTILDEPDFSDMADVSFRKKLQAAQYIGNHRLQLVDPKWHPGKPETLDDPGATIEDIDVHGGFDIPFYQRPPREGAADGKMPSGPPLPTSAPEKGMTRGAPERDAGDKDKKNDLK